MIWLDTTHAEEAERLRSNDQSAANQVSGKSTFLKGRRASTVDDNKRACSKVRAAASSSATLSKSKTAPLRAPRCTVQKKTEKSTKQGFSQKR